jgi:hypothetical protein
VFGPDVLPTPEPPQTTDGCLASFDGDFDRDVDAADFAFFQGWFGAP